MPFDEEFDPVYDRFIKPVFEDAGFGIERADDILSQQNILKDVIEGIYNSDVIVADLTSVNPNVFYELGLAHALRKRVILITQSIDEVPFDLKSYRLLEYSTHFAKIDKAKDQLLKYAKGLLEETMPFGSPVTDFLQIDSGPNKVPSKPTETIPPDVSQEDERGFLDHLIDINSGYIRIAGIANGVTDDLSLLTKALQSATNEYKSINANRTASSPTAARKVSRRLAEQIRRFTIRLKKANDEYASIGAGYGG